MNRRGFTLIELLITISVLIILTSILIIKLNPSKYFVENGAKSHDYEILVDAIELAEFYSGIPNSKYYDSKNPTEETLLQFSKEVNLESYLVPEYIDKIPDAYNNPWNIYKLPESPNSRDKGHVIADTLITMLEDGTASLEYKKFSYSSFTFNGKSSPFISDINLKNEIVKRDGIKEFPNIDNYLYYLYSGLDNLHILRINHPDRSETNLAAIRQKEDGSWEYVPYGQGYD